jgi:hypothetical protein
VTERGGTLDFTVTNPGPTDRRARIAVFYASEGTVQYGRDLWVPAHATLSSWLLVGPLAGRSPQAGRELRVLLYEYVGETATYLLPHGERRLPVLPYHQRQAATALISDPAAVEVAELARLFRMAAGLSWKDSNDVQELPAGPLLPTPETLRGFDHVLLASDRLADDRAGLKTLRRWVEQGGRLWVLLDRVKPATVAALLGDAFDFQVVDEADLTQIPLETAGVRQDAAGPRPPLLEQPVKLVHVLLAEPETARYTVHGWPAFFTRRVGRGKIVFSTLGPRAWSGPPPPPDPRNPRPAIPDTVSGRVPTDALRDLAAELRPPHAEERFPVEIFRPFLAEEIGYSIVGVDIVGLIFAAFFLAALVAAWGLRRTRRPELLGWLGPATALAAAGVFFIVGEATRQAAPPMVAVGQIVDIVPGTDEAAVHGLLAAYHPASGPTEAAVRQGGSFALDTTGLGGKVRRLLVTDLDRWHWEDLELPAGVRFAPFHYAGGFREPISAVAHFGPDGIEGWLRAGPFRDAGDALLSPPDGRPLAVHLQQGGTFRARRRDILPAGQFLASAVLSDRQQRRQELYRRFFQRPGADRLKDRMVLLAWAEPLDMHFTLVWPPRLVGDALLVIPLRLERPAVGAEVTIPGPLVPCRQITDVGPVPPTPQGTQTLDMHLRFQLPAEVLPLRVTHARLAVRITAPSRRVTVAGRDGRQLVELHRVESPLDDPITLDISDARWLRPDLDGGLHLNLNVSAPLKPGRAKGGALSNPEWTLEYVELEVAGRVGDKVTR